MEPTLPRRQIDHHGARSRQAGRFTFPAQRQQSSPQRCTNRDPFRRQDGSISTDHRKPTAKEQPTGGE
jgi:hypothetical protein